MTAAVQATGPGGALRARAALTGWTQTVARGECFGFLGPNVGAYKSTTMRMLCCLSRRDAGRLTVLGLDPDTHPRDVKARLGVVAQEITLDLLSVREEILAWEHARPTFRVRGGAAHRRAAGAGWRQGPRRRARGGTSA
ncbi:MAG: ATP-binding cassette domain-containing protein [Thermoleophilia bacterium]